MNTRGTEHPSAEEGRRRGRGWEWRLQGGLSTEGGEGRIWRPAPSGGGGGGGPLLGGLDLQILRDEEGTLNQGHLQEVGKGGPSALLLSLNASPGERRGWPPWQQRPGLVAAHRKVSGEDRQEGMETYRTKFDLADLG